MPLIVCPNESLPLRIKHYSFFKFILLPATENRILIGYHQNPLTM